MDTTVLILSIIIALLFGGFLGFIFYIQRKEAKNLPNISKSTNPQNVQLQLQAYERLALLTDRIALPNIISRLNISGVSGKEMQQILTQNIKQEFEHNITQQIYVSNNAWKAIKNLKDQNLLIVHQLGKNLPNNALGIDLSKNILEVIGKHEVGQLHEITSEIIRTEAAKII